MARSPWIFGVTWLLCQSCAPPGSGAGATDATTPDADSTGVHALADAAALDDARSTDDAPSVDASLAGDAVLETRDAETADAPAPEEDATIIAASDAGPSDQGGRPPYAAEYCAYFLTGEIDLSGTDADGDGAPNGWDHCPNNPSEWLDSDRDGVGNRSDPDLDGDGIDNALDGDRDGDDASDADELTAGTDPIDPSSIPGQRRFDLDLGVFNPAPGWYKGDLHIHTEPSHDSDEPLASYFPPSAEAGLDFMWITDHRVFETPFDPAWNQTQLLLIPGIEWGGGGHANIGGIRTLIEANYDDPADVRRSWRRARLQGGVQSLNHYGADTDYWDRLFAAAPDLLDAVDVFEVWNIFWTFNRPVNEASLVYWDQLLTAGYRIGAVGGSDTHAAALTLAFPTTVVWATSLSVPGILEGIRRGRTYITQSEPASDGGWSWRNRAELDFRIDGDGDGVFEAMLGDEVPAGPITLRVAVRHAHAPVIVIRNGVEIARFDSHPDGGDMEETLPDLAPPGAWYRVQMRSTGLSISPMLLLSSPIYVGP